MPIGYRKFFCLQIHFLSILCVLFQGINFDLTSGYLNLVANLVSLMVLLSRVDDRKAVLGMLHFTIEVLAMYCCKLPVFVIVST